jgi:hypothetical protein
VLPEVPVRHWSCSFRWGLRALLGYDKQICAEVLAVVIKELDRSLKRRAKKRLGLSTVKQALTGAVAAVQRVDSALRLNVHFHILGLDGVYVRPYPDIHRSELTFHDLPTPTREETEDIARSIADRVDAILKKHGRSLDPEESAPEPTEVQLEHPALAACYDAATLGVGVSGDRAGQPQLRLMLTDVEQKPLRDALPDEPVAEVRGVNLYGRQQVDGRDRKQIERLARYITRPPIAQERLTRCDAGTLLLGFTGRLRRLGAAGASPTVYLRGKLHVVDLVHSGSRRRGGTAASGSCCNQRTCWCVCAPRFHRRGFTWCATSASCRAIPPTALASCLSRPRIPRVIVHLQHVVTNSTFWTKGMIVHLQRLAIDGPGCWLMCFALTSRLARNAAGTCAG